MDTLTHREVLNMLMSEQIVGDITIVSVENTFKLLFTRFCQYRQRLVCHNHVEYIAETARTLHPFTLR